MGIRLRSGPASRIKTRRRRLGALAILSLESLLVWAALTPRIPPPTRASNATIFVSQPRSESYYPSDQFPEARNERIFYPYSVIPGGARDAAELRVAVAHDSAVARHYADFNLSKTRVVTLSAARAVFVSYRIGDGIFWTKNRMNLAAGETILTDGEHMARTRCGNRISDVPAQPLSKEQPTPEAMEVPASDVLLAQLESPSELPLGPAPATDIPLPSPGSPAFFVPPYVPVLLLGNSATPPGSPGGPSPTPPTPTPPGTPVPTPPGSPLPGPPTGPFPPPVPPGTPPPTPPGTPASPPPGTPPPIATPEPASYVMLVAGFACVLLRRKNIAKQN
jgi:hypothetical protein